MPLNQLKYFEYPFANNGDKNTIPNIQTPDQPNYYQGFIPSQSLPLSEGSGGTQVLREDINGILYDLSYNQYSQQMGSVPLWRRYVPNGQNDTILAYDKGALVWFPVIVNTPSSFDPNTKTKQPETTTMTQYFLIQSTIDNNTDKPQYASGANEGFSSFRYLNDYQSASLLPTWMLESGIMIQESQIQYKYVISTGPVEKNSPIKTIFNLKNRTFESYIKIEDSFIRGRTNFTPLIYFPFSFKAGFDINFNLVRVGNPFYSGARDFRAYLTGMNGLEFSMYWDGTGQGYTDVNGVQIYISGEFWDL